MRTLLAPAAIALVLTSPLMSAAAQDSRADAELLPAPALSDTDRAEPDWYRQFTLSTPDRDATQPWEDGERREFGLRWDPSNKFALNIDITKRPSLSLTPEPREEMSAGATVRLSPRFSVGGEVSIAGDDLDGSRLDAGELETGIRLQSAFKF